MAFAKKSHKDERPKLSKLEVREAKVQALKAENSIDSRKELKKMNDRVYKGGRSNLREWFAPKGKKQTARP